MERPEQELVKMEVLTNRIGNISTHINLVFTHMYSLTLDFPVTSLID